MNPQSFGRSPIQVVWYHRPLAHGPITADRVLLADGLAAAGVGFTQRPCVLPQDFDADLLIISAALPVEEVPDHTRILGMRTLNRKTRLDALSAAGLPVQAYGAPDTTEELEALMRAWGSDTAIIKFDWSYRRVGVFPTPHQDGGRPHLPSDFDPKADVVMKPVNGAPETIKVDAFAGHVLGASRLDTRAIGGPSWQTIGPRGQELWDLEKQTHDIVAAASKALLSYGVGMASFDVMYGDDGPVLIEANTTNVGVGFWAERADSFARHLVEAIHSLTEDLSHVPKFGAIRALTDTGGNAKEGWMPPTSEAPKPAMQRPELAKEMALLEQVKRLAAYDMVGPTDRLQFGQDSKRDLWEYARENVPAYQGKSLDALPVLKSNDIANRYIDFVCRKPFGALGTVTFARACNSAARPFPIPQTGLQALLERASVLRVARWAGVDDTIDMCRLLCLDDWEDLGLMPEVETAEVLARLSKESPFILWTDVPTARRFSAKLLQVPSLRPPILAVVLSDHPVELPVRQTLTTAFKAPVRETLFDPAVGMFGVRCPTSGDYHVFTELAEVEAPQEATGPQKIVASGFFNYQMPLFRVETGFSGHWLSKPNACDSPHVGGPLLRITNP